MRRRQPSSYRRSPNHSYRLELQLEFTDAVGFVDAKQVARRLTDALELTSVSTEDLGGLTACRLVCHELRKVIPLNVEPSDDDSGDAT